MREIFKSALLLVTVCCIGLSCGGDGDDPVGPDGGTKPPAAATFILPFEKLNQGTAAANSHAAAAVLARSSLKLNYRTYIALGTTELGTAVTDPIYPRIKKMKNGNYILFVNQTQHGGSCYYAISSNLKLWQPKGKIFSSKSITDMYGSSNSRLYATTDAVVLANGTIVAVSSYRANTGGYTSMYKDAGLSIRRSMDNGQTFTEPVDVYQGVNWEPCIIQLANGDIHCYFTDSSRTSVVSKDTGTVLIVSKDNGVTWSPAFTAAPYYVIRSTYSATYNGDTRLPAPIQCYNDQMPAVVQLNDGELAACMETANPSPATDYGISFAYSGEGTTGYPQLTATEAANKNIPTDRVTKSFAGAAPTMGQFRSGETFMTYSGVKTKMGNAKARNFPTSSTDDFNPFTGLGSGGYWGGTHVSDTHQALFALHTSDSKMRVAQVVLNHRITATSRTVTVDADNKEWADTDEALFVGAKSQAQTTLRCSSDANNIYFLLETLDNDVTDDDYVTLYVAPATGTSLSAGKTFRIKVSKLLATDFVATQEVYNASWGTSSDLGAVIKTKTGNTKTDKGGYRVELSIPRSKLTVTSGEILVNFAVYNKDTSGSATEDFLATSLTNTSKWVSINGL